MVYNGEIHNYLELAAELRHAGARLRADNDTEVLLWAYRLWGEACFARLNGMWRVQLSGIRNGGDCYFVARSLRHQAAAV